MMHGLHGQADEAECFPSNGFYGKAFHVNSHYVYILASSSCLYKIYIINKVFTESRLISAFYYFIT